ncbi:MAG TPA: TIM barrel protein [Clostridia bacterium]|jgi:deoxyribonuclease-4|nr:TIM barrel protein [Clostridia bacterium]
MIKFGVAGNSNSFYEEGLNKTVDAASWCKQRGIDIFEYSFGRGINLSQVAANQIKNAFQKENVILTVHAPYYINLSNTDNEMIEKSFTYIINSIIKAIELGANRVIIHPASQGKLERKEAELIMLDNIKKLIDILNHHDISDVLLCWETMGKVGQMGTVDEIINICKLDYRFIPCIDYGHINAREQGVLNYPENYNTLFQKLLDNLGFDKVANMHSHFSKIEYGPRGEIRHLTFEDSKYGPDYEPMIDALIKFNLTPYVVCESDGTQAEDAITMKKYYLSKR